MAPRFISSATYNPAVSSRLANGEEIRVSGPTSFQSLSLEVRHMVYKQVIPTGYTYYNLQPPLQLARLMAASRMVRDDAIDYFYSRNRFVLDFQGEHEYDEFAYHEYYYGKKSFKSMADIFKQQIGFIKDLEIFSKEMRYYVQSPKWPGFLRPMQYAYRLQLIPKSCIKNVKNDLTFNDDVGCRGEAVVVQDGLTWDSTEDAFAAFDSAASTAYGWEGMMQASIGLKEPYNALQIALAFFWFGKWIRDDYCFVFRHITDYEQQDHEIERLAEREDKEKREIRREEGRASSVDTEDWEEEQREIREERIFQGRDPSVDTEDWEYEQEQKRLEEYYEKRDQRMREGRDPSVDTEVGQTAEQEDKEAPEKEDGEDEEGKEEDQEGKEEDQEGKEEDQEGKEEDQEGKEE
ncbi:hypothetical protein Hte_012415 [Hypoxylon texense]